MGILEKVKTALLLSKAADRLKEAQVKGGLKVALVSIGGAVVTGVVEKVTEVCPALIPNLWTVVTAGVVAGIALWLRSPKDAPK
jgi:hypothetical protein